MLVAEIDIYRTAMVLIDNHGEMAAIEAGKRADAFMDEGNLDGVWLWKQVIKAIEEIWRTTPAEGETNH